MRKTPSLSLLAKRSIIRSLTAILSLCLIWLPLSSMAKEQGRPLPLASENLWTGDLDKMLFTFAAYNAGPAKVRRLRTDAEKMGLDPNIWFDNVAVAAAKRIGRETVQYVANIYKYYTAYRLSEEHLTRKEKEGGS